ncbi:MAG TPA: HAMP domain-containing sensor histidine kinase [Ramlibacter sp.]|nr:HAMP domain-containing sensor histidine kinase [Ramlibacter sp.]
MTDHAARASAPSAPEAVRPSVLAQARRWLKEEVAAAPLAPVRHASPMRVRGLGLAMAMGHPLSWWIWTSVLPQPHDHFGLRLAAASLGLLLMSPRVAYAPYSRRTGLVFSLVMWFGLPFVFGWMYLCNGGESAWLAQAAAMVLVYYAVTDWRLATVGLVLAAAVNAILFSAFGPEAPPVSETRALTDLVVLSSATLAGLLLGLSAANLRREQLANTLATMGVMAHELRTPLATMSLLGDAVRDSAASCPHETAARVEQLAAKLHQLVRNMNRQIDLQILNARLVNPPRGQELLQAAELVREAVEQFPYRSPRERDAVQVRIHRDFDFRGSRTLFRQVVDNLVKNALRSLAAAGTNRRGDLVIEVDASAGRGRIVFTDQGIGIEPRVQGRIFEPFFSTSPGTGHGLGLAFCLRVVEAAGGSIRVRSEPWQGASFSVELPVVAPGQLVR